MIDHEEAEDKGHSIIPLCPSHYCVILGSNAKARITEASPSAVSVPAKTLLLY